MTGEEGFVAFSYEEVNFGVGIVRVEFFEKGRGEDHVADEGGLYNEEFLHGAKVKVYGRKMKGRAGCLLWADDDVGAAGCMLWPDEVRGG